MLDTVVQETWGRIRDRLKNEIGEKFFLMWFERTRVLHLRRGVLAIGVPNLFIRDWVEEHYGPVLDRVAEEEIGATVRVAVKVDADLFREMRRETERVEEAVDTASERNPAKTLAQFLVTPGHEQTVRALRHVASGKRPTMNPLVIVGAEGSGKSHLAEALTRLYPQGTSFYLMGGEEFSRRYAWSLKTRKIESLRQEITAADLVILDDVQELVGKTATQRELANLADALLARGGQLVLLIDRPPTQMTGFEPTLLSFLLSGMIVEITPAGRTDTVRILRRVLDRSGRRVPETVIESVLDRIGGSVTRLDRLIRKLYAFAALTGVVVDDAFLHQHLTEVAGPADPVERRMDVVLGLIEERYDVERKDLLSKRKIKALSLPRALVVFVLREQAHLTYKEIGRLLGDRSHTSVYLMYKKYEEDIRQEPDLIAVIKESGRRMLATG